MRIFLFLCIISTLLDLTLAQEAKPPARPKPNRRKRPNQAGRRGQGRNRGRGGKGSRTRRPRPGGRKRRPTTKQSTTTPAPVTTKILTTKQPTTKLTPKPTTKPIVAKAPKRKTVVIPDVPLPGNKKWRGPGPKSGKYPKSCHDIFVKHAEKCNKPTQGFYAIQPDGALKPKYAECIFDDERGWTVVQQRYAGEVCFNRGWDEYQMGFGCPVGVGKLPDWYNGIGSADPFAEVDVAEENTSMCPNAYTSPYHADDGVYDPDKYPNTYRGPKPRRTDVLPECNGEMWLGLEYMYYVQKSHGEGGTKLCSYIAADRTTYQYVCYDKFAISNWQEDYKIREIDEFDIDLLDISDGFRGSGKNDLLGARFSTHDRDNDNSNGNCAADSNSGWWFNDCSAVNLNGLYHGSRTEKNTFDVKTGERTHPYPPNDGTFWRHRSKKWNSLRSTKMFIAPVEVKEYPCIFDS